MEKRHKHVLIAGAVLLGGALLLRIGDDGIAKQCVVEEASGQFASFRNTCDKPINVLICRQFVGSAERCVYEQHAAQAEMTVQASKDANLLIALLSSNPRVFACRAGFRPVRETGTTYRCERGDITPGAPEMAF